MDITTAIKHLEDSTKDGASGNKSLVIQVFHPGSIGGTPAVGVKYILNGFDWDNNKVILTPEVPLTTLTAEDVEAIHKSSKESQSWHAFQSYKKQADRIKELEGKVAQLTADLISVERDIQAPGLSL